MIVHKTGHVCLMIVGLETGKGDETKMKRREPEECSHGQNVVIKQLR